MPPALLILAIRKAVWILKGASSVNGNLFSRDSRQLELFFYGLLIVDVVFSCLIVEIHKLVRITEVLEFKVHIFIDFKLLLAKRCAELNVEISWVALFNMY